MATERTGLAIGLNKGHKVTRRELKPRVSRTKGRLSKRTAFVREIVKEVAGYVFSSRPHVLAFAWPSQFHQCKPRPAAPLERRRLLSKAPKMFTLLQ